MTLQGADTFAAKINIEVQVASELAIAAVEKNGGVITTAFFDPRTLGKNSLAPPLCVEFNIKKFLLNIYLHPQTSCTVDPHYL